MDYPLAPNTVKFGFVGPSHGDLGRLRALCERCLFEWQVDRVFYLGSDDALDRAAGQGKHERDR